MRSMTSQRTSCPNCEARARIMHVGATWGVLLVAIATIALYAVVIRRLLDVRTGVVRTVAAALFALYLAPILLQAQTRAAGLTTVLRNGGDPDLGLRVLFLCLSVLTATVTAMMVLVVVELLVPTGSIPRPFE